VSLIFFNTLRGVEPATFFLHLTIAGCTTRKLKIFQTRCGLYNPQLKKICKIPCGL